MENKLSNTVLPALLKGNFGQEIFQELEKKWPVGVTGMAGSAPELWAAGAFLTTGKSLLWLTAEKEEALYAVSELEELLGEENVLYFPPSHLEPYAIEKTQNANLVLRTEVLNQLASSKKQKCIVAPMLALAEKVLKKKDFRALSHTITAGQTLDFDFVDEMLHQFNFVQTDFVSEPGEFSVRGGIVDIFSYANEMPYRLTFFGNEVESIRTFDIETQLSKDSIQSFELVSNMNFAVETEKVPFFEILEENTLIATRNAAVGLDHVRKFYARAEENFEKLSKDIRHQTPQEIFTEPEHLREHLDASLWVDFAQQPLPQARIHLPQTPQPAFHKNFDLLVEDLMNKKKDGWQTYIACASEKQEKRLAEIVEAIRKDSQTAHTDLFTPFKSELHAGFADGACKLAVYTDHQIFDRYQRYKPKNSFAKSEQLTIKDLMSLKVGDYVTHIDHGVGKFLGLVKITNNGVVQESFKLQYNNNDLLYVGINALHKISKYTAPEGKEVTLNKLGSPAWKNLKNKTKTRVKQIAFNLIKLYSERKSAKGFSFSPDGYMQHELEASFIYEDTPDQEKATADTKKDMEADTIMDRLICGDVGFGKTEVAIRAAFKAATDSKQVAVLVPTTILAFQHYRSFTERLKDFPVNISYMNRFRSAKQKSETKEGLKNGKIDIVIGTHQLVGKDIQFKNLGLLIIDEEHKFGVNVKDRLKTYKNTVDTLTLTATPIPRTLQFSLLAARDLSVIKTPPPNRQPVETHIVHFSEELIRDAISYELERGGQVYFINNRIENMMEIAGLIQRLVPDARVTTGHGQMEGKELETRILDFMEGKYDVLVSTTIIESGVDVPNANTIFINDAQRFGMADLHQMRGRVGRGDKKAFAYLITPPMDMMNSDARKRLEAIEQFSDLGSGFQIAMKDLEIRGAGDLLGADQSGFINEMGFEAYQKIMQEALEELQQEDEFSDLFDNEEDRRKLITITKDVNVDTDWELMFPDGYISSTEERLVLYQRLAETTTPAALQQFENDLADRFGALPKSARDLLKSVQMKWAAASLGLERLVIKNGVLQGYFPGNPQDKYFQSETFHKIIHYLTTHPAEGMLKEKTGKEGSQLTLRKDGVADAEAVLDFFDKIQKG